MLGKDCLPVVIIATPIREHGLVTAFIDLRKALLLLDSLNYEDLQDILQIDGIPATIIIMNNPKSGSEFAVNCD